MPDSEFVEQLIQKRTNETLETLEQIEQFDGRVVRVIDNRPRPLRDYDFSDRRQTWDEWGLGIAAAVAGRADCTRRKVGAAIMDSEHTIVSTGYNGAPSGEPGCLTDGACPRGQMSNDEIAPGSSYDTGAGSCIAVHAEANALLRAPWSRLDGATIYCTEDPCDGCLRLVKGTLIGRIVTPSGVIALKP